MYCRRHRISTRAAGEMTLLTTLSSINKPGALQWNQCRHLRLSSSRIHLRQVASVEHGTVDWSYPGVYQVVEETRLVERSIWEQADTKGSSEHVEFGHSLSPVDVGEDADSLSSVLPPSTTPSFSG
jgi:hypothetical protein